MLVASTHAAADPPGLTATTTPAAPRRVGVGYLRGTGLGWYGASVATVWKDNVRPQLQVFGFFDDGGSGFALAPAIQLDFVAGFRSSPFIEAGAQYVRMWFGDATGGGFGGFFTTGWAFRFEPGIEIQLGVGLHGKQAIEGGDDMVSVRQRGNFGPHWDAGVRYWF
jgi:hypothetical protein